jgi:hypothetical protein
LAETALPWRIFYFGSNNYSFTGVETNRLGWISLFFNLFDIFVLPFEERFVGGKKPLWQKLPG